MKITKIEPQKRHKGRFNIYADNQFVCGLSEDTIIDSGLEVNQEITQQEIDQLIEKIKAPKHLKKLLNF